MKRPKRDPVREDRIHNEAIVDAGMDHPEREGIGLSPAAILVASRT